MTDSPMSMVESQALLDNVVSTVASVDLTINQLMAVKSALLATAARIADDEPFDSGHSDSVDAREMSYRAVATELGAVLRMSDRVIQSQMGDAARLVSDFPATAASFGAGRISQAHVRVILDVGTPIETPERRLRFDELAVAKAEVESPNRLRPFVKQLAERFRDQSFSDRHREAAEKRGVWVRAREDGMAELVQHGPSALIHAEHDRLTQMAVTVKTENKKIAAQAAVDDFADQRTMGQLRFDLLADLVLTGTPVGHTTADGLLGEITAHIDVTVPALSLTDDDSVAAPAHLEGIGPVDPATARILVGNAPGFDRVLTDPVSGCVLAVDRYRRTADMHRYLRARDRRCRFPGCRLLARACDEDHTVDYALGGATEIDNLADLCRRHHMTKHHTPWKVRQLGGGVLEWTSPTGRTHIDHPPGVATHTTIDDLTERATPPAPPWGPWGPATGDDVPF